MGDTGIETRPSLPPGMLVGGEYVIDRLLEAGEIWSVYCARHVAREAERFQVRVLRGVTASRRDLVEAFARQVQILGSLEHPAIPRVVGAGVDQGVVYMIVPDLPGLSLRQYLDRAGGRLELSEAIRIVREVASALDYLHGRRPPVVHGTLDTSKIFLVDPDRRVRLLEVGFAHAVAAVRGETGHGTTGASRVPEAFRSPGDGKGSILGPAADLCALADIARECLAGHGGTVLEDSELALMFTRACSEDAAERFPSAMAFVDALEEVLARRNRDRSGTLEVDVLASTSSPSSVTGSRLPSVLGSAAPPRPVPRPPPPPATSTASTASSLPGERRVSFPMPRPGSSSSAAKPGMTTSVPASSSKKDTTTAAAEQLRGNVSISTDACETEVVGSSRSDSRSGTLVIPDQWPSRWPLETQREGGAVTASEKSPAVASVVVTEDSSLDRETRGEHASHSTSVTTGVSESREELGESRSSNDPPLAAVKTTIGPAALSADPVAAMGEAAFVAVETDDNAIVSTESEGIADSPKAASSIVGTIPATVAGLPAAGLETTGAAVRKVPPSDGSVRASAVPTWHGTAVTVARIVGVSLVLASGIHVVGIVWRNRMGGSVPPSGIASNSARSCTCLEEFGGRVSNSSIAVDASMVRGSLAVPSGLHVDAAMDAIATAVSGTRAPVDRVSFTPSAALFPIDGGALPERPSWRARREAQEQIARRIDACEGRYGRHARLTVRYEGASGRAVEVRIAGRYFAGRPIANCIEQAVRAVVLPPFRRPYWDAEYVFMVH